MKWVWLRVLRLNVPLLCQEKEELAGAVPVDNNIASTASAEGAAELAHDSSQERPLTPEIASLQPLVVVALVGLVLGMARRVGRLIAINCSHSLVPTWLSKIAHDRVDTVTQASPLHAPSCALCHCLSVQLSLSDSEFLSRMALALLASMVRLLVSMAMLKTKQ